jgi:hypothetical protein
MRVTTYRRLIALRWIALPFLAVFLVLAASVPLRPCPSVEAETAATDGKRSEAPASTEKAGEAIDPAQWHPAWVEPVEKVRFVLCEGLSEGSLQAQSRQQQWVDMG